MRAAGTPKRPLASRISKPLFIIVAESTLTLAPIFQRGCARAWAGVTRERSAGPSRNGPPLAVRVRRSISSRPRLWRHWKIAECSLSTGRRRAPVARARAATSAPAATMTSFVASATSRPLSSAASVGARPERPTVATRTRSASVSATARSAASGPQKTGAPNARPSASARSRLDRTARAATRNASGCARMTSHALEPIEPVAPRRTIRFTAPRRSDRLSPRRPS